MFLYKVKIAPSSIRAGGIKSWEWLEGSEYGARTLEQIPTCTDWAQLSHTAVWHAGLAHVLRHYGHTGEALKHAKEAISIDGTLGLAYFELAFACVNNHNLSLALQTSLKGLQVGKVEPHLGRVQYDDWLGKIFLWQQRLVSTEAAVETLLDQEGKGQLERKSTLQLTHTLLQYNRHDAVTTFLTKWRRETIIETASSKATMYIARRPERIFHRRLRRAARLTDQVPFLRDMYRVAVHEATFWGLEHEVAWIWCLLTNLYYEDMGDEARAIHIWEQILMESAAAAPDSSLANACDIIAMDLTAAYLSQALSFRDHCSMISDQHIKQLENVDRLTGRRIHEGLRFWRNNNASAFLYRLAGRDQAANTIFCEDILFMTQPTTSNLIYEYGSEQYAQLAKVLWMAGHEIDGNIAWSFFNRGVVQTEGIPKVVDEVAINQYVSIAGSQERKKGSQTLENIPVHIRTPEAVTYTGCRSLFTGDGGKEDLFDSQSDIIGVIWAETDVCCRGPCCRGTPWLEGAWVCKYCIGSVVWCPGCFKLLQAEPLAYKTCGRKHEFAYVKSGEQDLPLGTAKLGDEIIKI